MLLVFFGLVGWFCFNFIRLFTREFDYFLFHQLLVVDVWLRATFFLGGVFLH